MNEKGNRRDVEPGQTLVQRIQHVLVQVGGNRRCNVDFTQHGIDGICGATSSQETRQHFEDGLWTEFA